MDDLITSMDLMEADVYVLCIGHAFLCVIIRMTIHEKLATLQKVIFRYGSESLTMVGTSNFAISMLQCRNVHMITFCSYTD